MCTYSGNCGLNNNYFQNRRLKARAFLAIFHVYFTIKALSLRRRDSVLPFGLLSNRSIRAWSMTPLEGRRTSRVRRKSRPFIFARESKRCVLGVLAESTPSPSSLFHFSSGRARCVWPDGIFPLYFPGSLSLCTISNSIVLAFTRAHDLALYFTCTHPHLPFLATISVKPNLHGSRSTIVPDESRETIGRKKQREESSRRNNCPY